MAISVSRRASAGIALIVAGALFLLVAVLPLLGVNTPWFSVLAYLAVAVAFAIIALGAVNNTVVKISLFAGAVGWLILAIAGTGLIAFPAGVVTFGAVLAALGGLVGAVVLLVGREVGNTGALAFVVAAILAVILLLSTIAVFALGTFAPFVVAVLGIAFVVTGVLFRRTERRGRR